MDNDWCEIFRREMEQFVKKSGKDHAVRKTYRDCTRGEVTGIAGFPRDWEAISTVQSG